MGVAAVDAPLAVVCHCAGHCLLERREGDRAEIRESARGVEQDRGGVVRRQRSDFRFGIVVERERLHNRVIKLLYRDVAAGRKVVSAVTAAAYRRNHRACQIADIDEIAPRRRYETLLALYQALEKDRQRAGDVARADNVRQPERNVVEPGNLKVILGGRLRDRVTGIGWVLRVVERDRLLQRLCPIAQRGLKIDEALYFAALGRLNEVDA